MKKRIQIGILSLFLVLVMSRGNAQALHGSYLIGPAPSDFEKLSQALNHICSQGIDGDVTLNIKSGTYSDDPNAVYLINCDYNHDYSVTIQSESGNPSDVVYTNAQWGLYEISHNLTIRNITLENPTGIAFRVWYHSTSPDFHNLTFDNCVFNCNSAMSIVEFKGLNINNCYFNIEMQYIVALPLNISESEDVIFSGNTVDYITPEIYDTWAFSAVGISQTKNLTVINNVINSNRDALTVAAPKPGLCLIEGNTLHTFYDPEYGQKVYDQANVGLSLFEGNFGSSIHATRNKITMDSRNNIGIYWSFNQWRGDNHDLSELILDNNFVSVELNENGNGAALVYASFGAISPQKVDIVNNSFNLHGTTENPGVIFIGFGNGFSVPTGVILWKDGDYGADFTMTNNIIANSVETDADYGTGFGRIMNFTRNYSPDLLPNCTLVSNHNNFYNSNSSAHIIKGFTSPYLFNNLSDWQAGSGYDANSMEVDPQFASPDDLHVGNSALRAGNPWPGITKDFDNEDRDPVTPWIGADEACQPIAANVSSSASTVYYGYAPQACATISAAPTGGQSPYSYLWSNGSTAASFSDCPTAATTYNVTVTDANGCEGYGSVSVNVVDVRCGNNMDKVLICHNNNKTLCIASSAVAAHLAHGCSLGPCQTLSGGGSNGQTVLTVRGETDEDHLDHPDTEDFSQVVPNPFNNELRILFSADEQGPAGFALYDQLGRLVKSANFGTVEAGVNFETKIFTGDVKPGVYLAKLHFGHNVETKRIVKD